MHSPIHYAVLLIPILALLAGCGRGPNPHADDDIRLSPAQERDIFIASNNLGPETSVIVIANVPKARYENGAIVLRPDGKEMQVIQPVAWRAYTGEAVSTEEARRTLQQADRIDQSVKDLSETARDLRQYLEDRAGSARRESKWQEQHENERLAEQERRRLERAVAGNRVSRQYEDEIKDLERGRDRLLMQNEKDRVSELDGATTKHTELIMRINERAVVQQQQVAAEHSQALKKETDEYQLAREIAHSKGAETYVAKLQDAYDAKVAKLLQGKKASDEAIRQDTAAELAKAREATGVRLQDITSRFETKAERIRHDHEQRVSRLIAEKEETERRAASSDVGARPPAPTPIPLPRAHESIAPPVNGTNSDTVPQNETVPAITPAPTPASTGGKAD